VEGDQVKVTEAGIQKLLASKEALTFPGRLAVVKITKRWRGYAPEPLEPEELERFARWAATDERITDVQSIPSLFLSDATNLQRLRYAAARIGASMLFVYAADTTTASGWTEGWPVNLLIVPYFFLSTQSLKSETAMEGVLVGVGGNAVHAVAAGKRKVERTIHNLSSSDGDLERLVEENRRETLQALVDDLAPKFARLR
jgi:hypothetical protein